MKLNIQYLQQALAQNKPNVKELAQRVSVSLIEQIDNLNYIASEFSNFAKLPEAKAEDIELNDFMKRAVELNLNESGIKHVFEESIVPLHVITDKSQLMSVCTNLLQNALQAMSLDREGEIIIKLERENDGAIISIKDNGTGIHGDVKDKIFKPYFTTKSSGTGLGLAMTRKIIESWQGSIWFETAINKGTSFFIKLPLKGN